VAPLDLTEPEAKTALARAAADTGTADGRGEAHINVEDVAPPLIDEYRGTWSVEIDNLMLGKSEFQRGDTFKLDECSPMGPGTLYAIDDDYLHWDVADHYEINHRIVTGKLHREGRSHGAKYPLNKGEWTINSDDIHFGKNVYSTGDKIVFTPVNHPRRYENTQYSINLDHNNWNVVAEGELQTLYLAGSIKRVATHN
jgi:hypothetical protein